MVADLDARILRDALSGDRRALRAFVDAMSPIIEARVARALLRRKSRAEGRDVRQEIEDMTQEVFGVLFANDGHVLRAWDETRGLSLANFVGLVADRRVVSILRSGKRSPWTEKPEDLDEVDDAAGSAPDASPQIESREELEALLDRLKEALSPRGLILFHRLYVDQDPVDEVAASLGMTRDAVYMWRTRVNKLLRKWALESEGSRRTPRQEER